MQHEQKTHCGNNCTVSEINGNFTTGNCSGCADPCVGLGNAFSDGNGKTYCCVRHTGTNKTICKGDNRAYYFKNDSTYDMCGTVCSYSGLKKENDGTYTITGISCGSGACQDPGCTGSWSYAKTSYGTWGCVATIDGKKVQCVSAAGTMFEPVQCLVGNNNATCGWSCPSYNTTICKDWRHKICAPNVTQNGVTKKACIYGQKASTSTYTVTDNTDISYDCWCDGNITMVNNIPYCCSIGQVYIDGACVLEQG